MYLLTLSDVVVLFIDCSWLKASTCHNKLIVSLSLIIFQPSGLTFPPSRESIGQGSLKVPKMEFFIKLIFEV